MKNKILMITAALAVMMALTGIAAADPAEVDIAKNPSPFLIGGGNIDESTVMTWAIDYRPSPAGHGPSHVRILTATTSSANVWVRVCDVAGDSDCTSASEDTGWSNDQDPSATTHKITYTATSSNTYTRSIYVKGTVDGNVYVSDNAGNVYNSAAGADAGSASAQVNIPEFATVAIPVAAVLGLVFFFQQRKNKKEE